MASYRGKHRKQTTRAGVTITKIAVVGAMAGAPMVIAAAPASASPNWDAVAQCESGGNWHTSTGNGYYGGLQFDRGTWQANGGGAYSATASGATREQQIDIANRLYAQRGTSPWPVCGKRGGGATHVQSKPVRKAKPKPAPKVVAHPTERTEVAAAAPAPAAGPADYTIQSGDTLSSIAAKQGTPGGWQALYEKNRDSVSNPNVIFPGHTLHTK